MENKKKIVLVLSGGAAKGSMQFGIVKYLYEQGLRPDAIYGTSVGSLNACGLSYIGVEGTERMWRGIKKTSDVFSINWLGPIKRLIGFVFKNVKWGGIYCGAPLRKQIQKCIDDGQTPKVPAYACKVSLRTGEIKYVAAGDPDYGDSVLASSSVPVISDPVGEWTDGGVREQSPLKKAIQDGADKIVLVLCNPYRENPDVGEYGQIEQNLVRATDILAHEVFKNDVDNCIWYNKHLDQIPGKKYIEIEVYAPRKLVIDSHDFNQEKIVPAIAYGYECGKMGPVLTDKSNPE